MKATLKNERGKYFSVELNGDVYQLYHDLRDNGLNVPPHRIPIKFGTVSLTSDSELEQNMIRLFRETDSLDDVVTMLTTVRDMREDIRPKFEQWMRSNLYSNKDEVYEHIRELKVALANEKMTFYCPLEGNIYNYGIGIRPSSRQTVCFRITRTIPRKKSESVTSVRTDIGTHRHSRVTSTSIGISAPMRFAECSTRQPSRETR